jgi:hypothetical protein
MPPDPLAIQAAKRERVVLLADLRTRLLTRSNDGSSSDCFAPASAGLRSGKTKNAGVQWSPFCAAPPGSRPAPGIEKRPAHRRRFFLEHDEMCALLRGGPGFEVASVVAARRAEHDRLRPCCRLPSPGRYDPMLPHLPRCRPPVCFTGFR